MKAGTNSPEGWKSAGRGRVRQQVLQHIPYPAGRGPRQWRQPEGWQADLLAEEIRVRSQIWCRDEKVADMSCRAHAASRRNFSASDGCWLQAYFACCLRIISMPSRITRVLATALNSVCDGSRPVSLKHFRMGSRRQVGSCTMVAPLRKSGAASCLDTPPSAPGSSGDA